jgi:hypothetical protein
MIRLAIAFVIIFTVILILRWTVLPHLKVFFHALPPAPLWEGIWNLMIGVGQQLMPYILVVFVFIYFIIKFINNVLGRIPLVGKVIKRVAMRVPPLPDFNRSGLVGLFDGIFGIVFSRDSIKVRIQKLGYAIGAFIEQNINYSVQTTDEVLGITPMLNKFNSKLKIPDTVSVNVTNGKGNEFIKETPDSSANEPDPILSDEQREIDDKYQQCISENIQPVLPDMSKDDIEYIKNQNQLAQVRCKVKKVQNSISFMTNKYV